MKFVLRIFHFVEVVHTYVMSSVSESLDIKGLKNVVVVHSWEDRSPGSLLNCFNFVRQVTRHPYWGGVFQYVSDYRHVDPHQVTLVYTSSLKLIQHV